MNQEKPTGETPPKMHNGHHTHQHEHVDHEHAGHEHAPKDHHAGHDHAGHAHGHGMPGHDHHAMMVADFRKRFWVSLVLTIPILMLSPLIQGFLGLEEAIHFTGDLFVLFALSSVVFVGGFFVVHFSEAVE